MKQVIQRTWGGNAEMVLELQGSGRPGTFKLSSPAMANDDAFRPRKKIFLFA